MFSPLSPHFGTLQERPDPSRFFRIDRSAMVGLDLVETLLRNLGSDYAPQLRGGVRLKVSRSRFEELEKRMGAVPVTAIVPLLTSVPSRCLHPLYLARARADCALA
jgi:hypothetical protein